MRRPLHDSANAWLLFLGDRIFPFVALGIFAATPIAAMCLIAWAFGII
jgi:hypothetical protein